MIEVPNHDDIRAGLDGKLYSPAGNVLKEYTNGDGYKTVLVNENGKFSTKGVHRLIAMAYHETEQDVNTLLVNHLDLDKSNNEPKNLEWVTAKENSIHAALMGVNSKSDRIIANSGDKYMLFKDCHALAEHLDIEVETAYRLVKSDKDFLGWTFKHRPTGEAIPESLHRINIADRDILGRAVRKPVSIVDIFTRCIMEFDSISSAARYLKVPTHHISQRVSGETFKLFNLNWMIFYGTEKDVPVITEDIITKAMRGKKRLLICKDPEDNVTVYMSAKVFYTDKELSKKAVMSRLSKNGMASYKGYQYAYAGTPLATSLLNDDGFKEIRA